MTPFTAHDALETIKNLRAEIAELEERVRYWQDSCEAWKARTLEAESKLRNIASAHKGSFCF